MKLRTKEQGVVLVITLIMLSVVTLMAIVFLGVSRRERATVTVTTDHINAKLSAEAGMARAQSEVVGRILSSSNRFDFDYVVSTNFFNPDGYDNSNFNYDPGNANYFLPNGNPIPDPYNQSVNIGNQFYDSRPPVYIEETEYNQQSRQFERQIDFRYYLDFNRNGRFEPSGLLPVLDENNRPLQDTETGENVWTRYVGDPQWIGLLEYPNQPHSATNRFVGRFAYIIVPEGRTLDLNTIHNQIKQTSNTQDFFVRNQGIGPWEINLGAFLRDLNPRIWTQYQYAGPGNNAENIGNSFRDAFSLLNYRRADRALAPLNVIANPSNVQLQQDFVDLFANGPYLLDTPWLASDLADTGNQIWWGSEYRRAFYDVQELFNGVKIPNADGVPASNDSVSDRVGRIPSLAQTSTYDRYTYYRLISQLGTESISDTTARSYRLAIQDNVPRLEEVRTNKLHLNYDNFSNHQTNYVNWSARDMFMLSANRLLMANMATNPPAFTYLNEVGQQYTAPGTNFHLLGDTYVDRDFSVTNIQIWPEKAPGVNEYSANLHQLLQLAANLTDPVTVTNRPLATFAGGNQEHLPLVFRPRFNVDDNDTVTIFDYIEVTNDAPVQLNKPFRDLRFKAQRDALNPDDNVIGIPWVISAKKGLPNFNEYGVLTTLEMTRKLEINKTAPNAPMNQWQTNQMIVMGISNMYGLETWNSYRSNYPRAIRMQAQVQSSLVVTNRRGMLLRSNWYNPSNERLMTANEWQGQEFVVPMQQTFITLTNSVYDHASGRLVEASFLPQTLFPDRGIFPSPQIGLAMTNRVQCFMLDEDTQRILDFVNLDNLTTRLDVTQELLGAYGAGTAGPVASSSTGDSRMFWVTNRLGNSTLITAPTEGVINQIFTSLDEIPVSQRLWNSFRARGTGRDREESIDLFRTFIGFPPKYLTAQQLAIGYQRLNDPRKSFVRQVPFTPSLKKIIYTTWQANDPLVHYTKADLTDMEGRSSRRELVDPPDRPLDGRIHNIGLVNARYRPWPSGPGSDVSEYDVSLKDPMIRSSDDWQFPTNRYPNIGWLGRVHRGTPWQTVYLKSAVGSDGAGRLLHVTDMPQLSSPLAEGYPFQTLHGDPNNGFEANAISPQQDGSRLNVMEIAQRNWLRWSGSVGTHPTNDWKILEQFTTALDDNAARGLLSVNQTGLSAWSAVLSGVIVQTNMSSIAVMNRDLDGVQSPQYRTRTIEPAGLNGLPENQNLPSPMTQMVNGPTGINGVRQYFPNGRFQYLGQVLSAPALTLQSPYLAWGDEIQYQSGIDDFAYERIPQQVLSLLKADEPRVTIYAYGQSLRPANESLRADPEPPRLFNICTNYQVTGEYLFRRVVRFDGAITNLQATVESETVLPFD